MSDNDEDVSPTVKFIQDLFNHVHKIGATFIVVSDKPAYGRFYVLLTVHDGKQTPYPSRDLDYEAISTRLMIMSNMNITDRESPQNGKFGFFGQEGDSDILMFDDGSSNDPEIVAARERKFSFVCHYVPPILEGARGTFFFNPANKQP